MPQITQPTIIADGLIVASAIQEAINQLYATINLLDKDNLDRSGNKFLWGNVKLDELVDPDGAYNDGTDLQVAVTKGYLKTQLFDTGGLFDSATGNWHLHNNKAVLDAISAAGSGSIITAAERANLPTTDQKAAMDGAASPAAANVFATMNDIPSAQAATLLIGDVDEDDGAYPANNGDITLDMGQVINQGMIMFKAILSLDAQVAPLVMEGRIYIATTTTMKFYEYVPYDVSNPVKGHIYETTLTLGTEHEIPLGAAAFNNFRTKFITMNSDKQTLRLRCPGSGNFDLYFSAWGVKNN